MDVIKMIAAAKEEIANRPAQFKKNVKELSDAFDKIEKQSDHVFTYSRKYHQDGIHFYIRCKSLCNSDEATLFVSEKGSASLYSRYAKSITFNKAEDVVRYIILQMAENNLFKSLATPQPTQA